MQLTTRGLQTQEATECSLPVRIRITITVLQFIVFMETLDGGTTAAQDQQLTMTMWPVGIRLIMCRMSYSPACW